MTGQEKNKMWCSVWCGDGTVAITKKPDVHSPKCPYYEDQPNTGDVTDWEKDFDLWWKERDTEVQFTEQYDNSGFENMANVLKSFISKLLANQRQEIVEDICVLIDEIESQSQTNTLEEWKQYKHIRNAIRGKYILKEKE